MSNSYYSGNISFKQQSRVYKGFQLKNTHSFTAEVIGATRFAGGLMSAAPRVGISNKLSTRSICQVSQ